MSVHTLCLESSKATLPLVTSEAPQNAAMSLLLPGKVLHPNALFAMRMFRDCGNKGGAVCGFEALQDANLGKLFSVTPSEGSQCGKVLVQMLIVHCIGRKCLTWNPRFKWMALLRT